MPWAVLMVVAAGVGVLLASTLLDAPASIWGAAIIIVGMSGLTWWQQPRRAPAVPLPPPPPSEEPEVVRADRIEGLGVLAGGIAHDFNNLLTGILGNAQLALTELDRGSVRDSVLEIELASRRAQELVSQLLAYAGHGRLEVQAVNLGVLVEEMVELLKRVVDPNAELVLDLGGDSALVEADPRQLRQIVMNLITNASDALGGAPGRIHIIVSRDELMRADLDPTEFGSGLPTGDYVRLEVIDTGCGMDVETRARIFEPFFTTKFTGRGLGLAALQGIVKHHLGTLSVTSEPGAGSHFSIWLPWAELLDEDEDIPTEHGGEVASWKHRAGMVLLAEDEDIVRRAATRMLSKLGFDVIAAVDGEDALEAFRDAPDDFVLAMLDVQMPGMDGIEALRRIRAQRPTLPVILCTGFTDLDTDLQPDAWLHKPFSIKDLLDALDRALTHHSAPTVEPESSQDAPYT